MAGDKIISSGQFENADKMSETGDCKVNLNFEDDYEDAEDNFFSCPEFQFSTSSCYICNGYYGPCFEEPVCSTCHAFLFPDDSGSMAVAIFSEKTDDEDSGNDEPTDMQYNHERRTSQQQQNSPQNFNFNSPHVLQSTNTPPRFYVPMPDIHAIAIPSRDEDINMLNQNISAHFHNNFTYQNIVFSSSGINCFNNQGNMRQDSPYSQRDLFNELRNIEDTQAQASHNLGHLEQYRDTPWNFEAEENFVESSQPYSLSERIEVLTNHRHIEHEPINDSGLVERLPPEVLLAVFSHLDDVSLWSAANVCRRWSNLLSTEGTLHQWQQRVKLRWPLYRPLGYVKNWYSVYDQLASSAPCRTCLAQICIQSRSRPMTESSWRRIRLRGELRGLKSDPPEGIEAIPLDPLCCHWQATITGPVGSPYEGGLFFLYLQVPYSYPMRPPIVRFITKILHPNVSRHGDVGIDSIHHNWSLALTIPKVLISVQSLLTDPYCQVCMEPELGEMYMNDREKFEEVARAWTWKYAMHDVAHQLNNFLTNKKIVL